MNIEEILNKIYTSDLLSSEELHELTEWVCNKDEEIKRLNNILDTLMQDMAVVNAIGEKELKPKYVFDRIAMLRGDDKE